MKVLGSKSGWFIKAGLCDVPIVIMREAKKGVRGVKLEEV